MKVFIHPVMVGIGCWLLAHHAIGAETTRLRLSTGTWSLGGSLAFPIEYDHLGVWKTNVSIQPTAGIFVLPNWELLGGLSLKTSPRADSPVWNWGFGIGTQYYLNFRSPVVPFIGAHFALSMNNWMFQTLAWSVIVPVGIMIPVNEHVAIEVAVRTEVKMNGQTLFDRVVCTPGHFGLRVFL